MMEQFEDRDRNNKFWRFDGWGTPILGVLFMLLVLVAISASQARSADAAEEVEQAEEVCAGHDCGERHRGHWGHRERGHHFSRHRGRDPEVARERMQYATGWMLKRLDVEDEVKEQIQARLDTAFDELLPLVEAHKGTHEIWLEAVLSGDEVDREGLEAQRHSAMADADRASQILTSTLADVAEMLTPEQRAEIAEKIRKHHH
ncbi:MAG: hypothetical protein JRE71_06805 [Deltaproteobacteria bacterium]|nr:hypothetical protein [Deltaproteobacteria bacterium]